VELPRRADAGAIARRYLSNWLKELDADDLHRAKLLCSELVNNAVLHGRGRVRLRAALDDDRVLVEVIDEGDGFEREARRHGFQELGGNGLTIVESEASRWGIHEGTTHVWFELERSGPRLGRERKPGL
jgi:anti-sigma regulatory factor (Ser/Thr protein kinase)